MPSTKHKDKSLESTESNIKIFPTSFTTEQSYSGERLDFSILIFKPADSRNSDSTKVGRGDCMGETRVLLESTGLGDGVDEDCEGSGEGRGKFGEDD